METQTISSMIKQGKVWGNTVGIFNRNNVEIHRIEAKKGGFCSKHKHNHKYNMFYVESGVLEITIWKNDYSLVDTTVIKAGEATTAAPKEYHRFKALEDAVVYEIYWTELSPSDIERENTGGNGTEAEKTA